MIFVNITKHVKIKNRLVFHARIICRNLRRENGLYVIQEQFLQGHVKILRA